MLKSFGTGADMTVYVEYVLLDNFIIDYLLLKATYDTTGVSVRKGWLFLCAFFGALIALVYPLISIKALSLAVKILCGFLLTLIATKYKSKRSYFINTALFFCYTFLTGGAIFGVFYLFGIDYSCEFSIALTFIPAYILIKGAREVVIYIYRQKHVINFTYEIALTLGDKTVNARGFMDTGNGLYDGNSPIVVCDKRFAKKLINENFYKIKSKKIMLSTVNGASENFAFILDNLVIYIKDEQYTFNKVTMAVTKRVGDGYDVILHPAFLEVMNDKRNFIAFEKTS